MSNAADHHHEHMARALELAGDGRFTTDPNPAVGCVLVRDGERVGEGCHRQAGEPHAERHALRVAGERARGATCYVTLEPCAHTGRTGPCAEALIEAGVSRVVAAMQDPNPLVAGQGFARLRAAGIEVSVGLLERQARALNPGFIKRMQTGLPLLRVKLAMSLDGRTALANGESKWITGPAAREDVQYWRAAASAIVTGVGTVLADDPALTVRPADWRLRHYPGDRVRQPLRVVLDSVLRTPPTARLLKEPGDTLILTRIAETDPRACALIAQGASVQTLPGDDGQELDLPTVLQALAERHCNTLLVEAGPTLAGALMAADLVDELLLYMAPTLLGDQARPLLALPQLATMADRIRLQFADVSRIGDDLRLTLTRS